MLIHSEEEGKYGNASTAGEEKFEWQREESMRLLDALALMWARHKMEYDIAELMYNQNFFISSELMARNYYSIALQFGFVDLAEEIKAKFQI